MPDSTTVFTSYESGRWPSDLLNSVTIWQVARATSAASSFFEPIKVGPNDKTFLDGVTGANNPVDTVWEEANDIWRWSRHTEDNVQYLVSIGTRVPNVQAFGSSLKSIGETLKDMSTETETTVEEFLRRNSKLADNHQ
jgi:predicted acylesterase/phospholipase RssA